jgi:thimet oligopeptidase
VTQNSLFGASLRNTLKLSALSACLVLVGCAQQSINQLTKPMIIDGFNPNLTAAEYKVMCDGVVSNAKSEFKAIETDQSPATLKSVMGAYDNMLVGLQNINQSWYLKAVHPDESIREVSTACSEQVSEFYSEMGMSRPLYERIAAIDLSGVTAEERFMVEKSLESFKQAGVDKDEATRQKIKSLRQEINKIGNEFSKNIQEDVRYVDASPEQLRGLPQDYIDNHQPNEQGIVVISTDYPDIGPILIYGEDDSLRHQLRIASRSRGYPKNDSVLKKLITKRHELANLLGYKNWAALSMSDKMIGTPEFAQSFLNDVGAALKQPVIEEKKVLLERLHQINPAAKEVNVWQASYLKNKLRQEQYALDSKEVRKYFSYTNVRDGIFQLTQDLFGVEIKPWKTDTWHEEVETYEIWENGRLLGRFYMDNHPRANKYKHAAHWTLRSGIKDKQIPLSALAQNFPKGLMEHGQVETFLHEFGHLLHNMFAGTQEWQSIAGMSMERDFVEAPSQMLEEWVWDYDTLKLFAKNEAGEVIPKELVDKMKRARNFGQAIGTATQIYYANLSLNYYSRDPQSLDLMAVMRELSDRFNPYPFVEGTAFYCNFGHLNGYSSNYYTYQWSLAIATDMFSVFQKKGMRNPEVAQAYRDLVLSSGGSKPARDAVALFLEREFSPDAYINKLKNAD